MNQLSPKSVVVIVAHPDDETLWAGGTILNHPEWKCFIISLCRAKDENRSPRFFNALKILGSEGIMCDLNDGPEQVPLDSTEVEQTIMDTLPAIHFDLIITHNPNGEYTRHHRHEEAGKAVLRLWNTGKISTSELWLFAYTDNCKKQYPMAVENASICNQLTPSVWQTKYEIITKTYGFDKNSFEAETTPRTESFWKFRDPLETVEWLKKFENLNSF